MKTILVVIMMLFGLSFNSFIQANDREVRLNEVKLNERGFEKYLQLDSTQVEDVKTIQYNFMDALNQVPTIEDKEARQNYLRNAILYSLRNMRYFLDERQYAKYLRILNVTLNNRGIKAYEIEL